MFTFRLKAVRAFAQAFVLAGIVGGLVVGCQDSIVKDSAVAEQNATLQNDASNSKVATAPKRTPLHDAQGDYYLSKVTKEKVYVSELQALTSDLSILTKATARALADNDTRNWLYKRASERFDGQSNVLWKNLDADKTAPAVMKSLSGGENIWTSTLETSLRSESGKAQNATFKSGKSMSAVRSRLESIFNAPIHFFWMQSESWDKKTAPLVAFIRVDTDPKQQKTLTAFDAEGNSYTVDKEIAKTRPVVLINFNERADIAGNLKPKVNAVASNGKSSPAMPHSVNSVNTICAPHWQEVPALLTAFSVYFHSWANYDEWFDSTPEFFIETLNAANWVQMSSIFIGEQPLDTWINLNVGLTNQAPRLYDVVVKYWEEDFWFFDDYIGEHRFICSPCSGSFSSLVGNNPIVHYYWDPAY